MYIDFRIILLLKFIHLFSIWSYWLPSLLLCKSLKEMQHALILYMDTHAHHHKIGEIYIHVCIILELFLKWWYMDKFPWNPRLTF